MSTFQLSSGLRNPHIQSVVSRFMPRQRLVLRAASTLRAQTRPLLLHGGEGQLLAFHNRALNHDTGAPLAVLIHGWEGSSESLYLLASAARLHAEGWQIVRLNLRDHGASHHLNEALFHSCRDGEVTHAIADAITRLQPRHSALVGFSLGGNFALRVGTRLPLSCGVRGIVAVCPVLDPHATLIALEQGPWLYRHYFLRKWRQSLRRKAKVHPTLLADLSWQAQRTLTAMTDHFVRGHTEFDDLERYLAGYAITGSRLRELICPAHVILAADDPVIPIADWARVDHGGRIECERTAHGGHCGFIADWSFNGWIEQRIAEVLRTTLGYVPNTQATIAALPDRDLENE